MFKFFKSPPPLTTPDAVRDAILDRLSQTGRISSVTPKDEEGLGLDVTADGKVHSFFLENAIVAVLQKGPNARVQHREVRHYVSAFLSTLDEPPLELDRVFPIVRHRDYVVIEGIAAIHTPVVGDLVCTPALDTPQTLVTLTTDAVDQANLAMAEVWGAARVNLSVALKGIREADTAFGTRVLMLDEPWLGTSILLAPDLIQNVRRDIGAKMLYVAAHSREGVEFIDSAEPDAYEKITRSVREGLQADHPQSAYIFTLTEEDEAPVPGWRFEDGTFHPVA